VGGGGGIAVIVGDDIGAVVGWHWRWRWELVLVVLGVDAGSGVDACAGAVVKVGDDVDTAVAIIGALALTLMLASVLASRLALTLALLMLVSMLVLRLAWMLGGFQGLAGHLTFISDLIQTWSKNSPGCIAMMRDYLRLQYTSEEPLLCKISFLTALAKVWLS